MMSSGLQAEPLGRRSLDHVADAHAAPAGGQIGLAEVFGRDAEKAIFDFAPLFQRSTTRRNVSSIGTA